jgi:hypothetical protein
MTARDSRRYITGGYEQQPYQSCRIPDWMEQKPMPSEGEASYVQLRLHQMRSDSIEQMPILSQRIR